MWKRQRLTTSEADLHAITATATRTHATLSKLIDPSAHAWLRTPTDELWDEDALARECRAAFGVEAPPPAARVDRANTAADANADDAPLFIQWVRAASTDVDAGGEATAGEPGDTATGRGAGGTATTGGAGGAAVAGEAGSAAVGGGKATARGANPPDKAAYARLQTLAISCAAAASKRRTIALNDVRARAKELATIEGDARARPLVAAIRSGLDVDDDETARLRKKPARLALVEATPDLLDAATALATADAAATASFAVAAAHRVLRLAAHDGDDHRTEDDRRALVKQLGPLRSAVSALDGSGGAAVLRLETVALVVAVKALPVDATKAVALEVCKIGRELAVGLLWGPDLGKIAQSVGNVAATGAEEIARRNANRLSVQLRTLDA